MKLFNRLMIELREERQELEDAGIYGSKQSADKEFTNDKAKEKGIPGDSNAREFADDIDKRIKYIINDVRRWRITRDYEVNGCDKKEDCKLDCKHYKPQAEKRCNINRLST